jgi:putative ATP-dependent endonuclease of the OLD family
VKLAQVEVRNYRSLFMDGNRAFTVELADGINALIGPNNCGKSNVLRAVALALDPNYPFDRDRDNLRAGSGRGPGSLSTFAARAGTPTRRHC